MTKGVRTRHASFPREPSEHFQLEGIHDGRNQHAAPSSMNSTSVQNYRTWNVRCSFEQSE